MNIFNPIYVNSAWTYLISGDPPPLLLLAIANGVMLFLFLYYRGKKSKVDYKKTKSNLQIVTVLANSVILFGDSFTSTMQNAFYPLKGMLNFL
jgi:hypothetical protein